MPQSRTTPKLTVIVATAQSLKLHGGVPENKIKEQNIEGMKNGFENLDKHVENMKRFGQEVIVTFNRYASDTDEEIALVAEHCREIGVGFCMNNVFAAGGEGGAELAKLVVDTIEKKPSTPLKYIYEDDEPIRSKIKKVSEQIYGAASVVYTTLADKKIKQIESLGISHYPICIAKTQYSFSSDPKAYGVAKNFRVESARHHHQQRCRDDRCHHGRDHAHAGTAERPAGKTYRHRGRRD